MTFESEKQQFEENARNKTKGGVFQTVFTRGRVEIGAPLNPIEFSERRANIKFNKLKKLLLIAIICALTLTVLLIIKQITVQEIPEPNTSAVMSADTGLNLTANQLEYNTYSKVNTENSTTTIEATTLRESTPTEERTPLTTEERTPLTTAPKIIDHLLASLFINHAVVPNKDGLMSLTDAYVQVFVDEDFIGQTTVKKESLTPVWNYKISHQMILRPEDVLKFKLYDNDKYSSHEFIGEFDVKTSELIADASNGKQVHRHHGSGDLWFTVIWEEVYRSK